MQKRLQGSEEEKHELSRGSFKVKTNNTTMEKELHEWQKHQASFSPEPKVIRDPDEIRQTVMGILKKSDPGHVDKINDIMARFRGKEDVLLRKTISRYRNGATELEKEIPESELAQEVDNKTDPKKEDTRKSVYTPVCKRSQLAERKHRKRLEVSRMAMKQ